MAIQIKFKRGTKSEWDTANPVLRSGELVVESNTSQVKIGNGSSTYTQLSYGFDAGDPPILFPAFFG